MYGTGTSALLLVVVAIRVEVVVHNTLANHCTTIPTRNRGRTTSGMLGPVKRLFEER
jgi:hypothetical protein